MEATEQHKLPMVTHIVRIGGLSKEELLSKLHEAGVRLNEYGQALFADERFTTTNLNTKVETVELTVAELGFGQGATFTELVDRATRLGLTLCPLELGPHLRLQYLDQPEAYLDCPQEPHRAPAGSITIASPPVADDDDTPKGFYLRRIGGELWLRAFRAATDHIYRPEDHFVFLRPNSAD